MSTTITTIRFTHWKGLDRDHYLADRTILVGPNGTGKSAILDGIRYAMTGDTPAGRSADAVEAFFGPTGGAVRIDDSDGAWIERGIEISAKSGKRRSILDTEPRRPDDSPDLTRWEVDPITLDLSAFLGLSSQKRREFFMDRCGVHRATPGPIFAQIEEYYAREIAGQAATPATLRQPDRLDEHTRSLAERWTERRGLHEQIHAKVQDIARRKMLLPAAMNDIVDYCREQKNAAQTAAKEASAAISELEREAKDAKPLAEMVRKAAEEYHDAVARAHRWSDYLERIQVLENHVRQARGRVEERAKTQAQILGNLNTAEANVAAIKNERADHGYQDLEDQWDKSLTEDGDAVEKARWDVHTYTNRLARINTAVHELHARRKDVVDIQASLDQVNKNRIARLVELMDSIPDTAHPHIPPLRDAISEIAKDWRVHQFALVGKLDAAKAALKEHQSTMPTEDDALNAQRGLEAAEATLAATIARRDKTRDDLKAIRDANHASKIDLQKAIDSLEAARCNLAASEAHRAEAAENLEAREAEIRQARSDAPEPADDREVQDRQEAHRRAQEAAGKVLAYEAALTNERRRQAQRDAWKAAEIAARNAREALVADSVSDLVDDIDGILRAMGRQETAYCRLETDRGTPTFQLGWITSTGAWVPIEALSAGETACFGLALTLALAKRSHAGLRKILLIEADPLDYTNLELVLEPLADRRLPVDQVVVATSRDISSVTVYEKDNWAIIDVRGPKKEVPSEPATTPAD